MPGHGGSSVAPGNDSPLGWRPESLRPFCRRKDHDNRVFERPAHPFLRRGSPPRARFLSSARGTSATSLGSLSALIGASGKLTAIFSLPGDPALGSLAGRSGEPGVYPLAGSGAAAEAALQKLSLIVLKPFSAKVNGRIGTYRMGNWPYEGRDAAQRELRDAEGLHRGHPRDLRNERLRALHSWASS